MSFAGNKSFLAVLAGACAAALAALAASLVDRVYATMAGLLGFAAGYSLFVVFAVRRKAPPRGDEPPKGPDRAS